MEFSPEELAKLPKWAVSRIQKLENDKASTEERLDIATGTTVTNVFQRREWMPREPEKRVYLDPRREVVFDMNEMHRAIEVRWGSDADTRCYGPHIRIVGSRNCLSVSPECANVVRISSARR